MFRFQVKNILDNNKEQAVGFNYIGGSLTLSLSKELSLRPVAVKPETWLREIAMLLLQFRNGHSRSINQCRH